MQQLICALCLCFTVFSIGQNARDLPPFQAISSNIGADVHIVKSENHHIEFSGPAELLDYIDVEIDNSSLQLTTSRPDLQYDGTVRITVFAPKLQTITMSNRGTTTMDDAFSRIATLVVSVEDEAMVDLSNIDFQTLITASDRSKQVLYKSAQTVVSSYNRGKGVSLKN